MENQQNPVEFLGDSNSLLLNVKQKGINIKITIMNQAGETIDRMQFIGGRHRIDLSALPEGEYSIRMQSGENVTVKKISIHHNIINQ